MRSNYIMHSCTPSQSQARMYTHSVISEISQRNWDIATETSSYVGSDWDIATETSSYVGSDWGMETLHWRASNEGNKGGTSGGTGKKAGPVALIREGAETGKRAGAEPWIGAEQWSRGNNNNNNNKNTNNDFDSRKQFVSSIDYLGSWPTRKRKRK